jgi:RNA polymerase sigma factor (sigma-70 family)
MPRTNRLDDIEQVYRSRGADFYRLACARTGDAASARDAVQEGFARAIRHRDRFRGTGSLEAWIGRCVLNAAHDQAERGWLAPATDADEDVTHDPEPPDEVLRAAVRQLPSRQRDALFLRYYLDFDYAQIAAALDIRVGTVSATLHAARAALAQLLQEVS